MANKTKKEKPILEAYGNAWTDVVGDIADSQIHDIEAALGIKMPADLAEFLLVCGGGRPKRPFYWSSDTQIEVTIGYVLPLVDHGKREGLAVKCRRWRAVERMPNELIPFALDNGNANLICVRLPAGDIVYYLHDDEERPTRPVAPSLKEYLSGLEDLPY